MDSRYIQQFKKGSLEMILLCLIAKRETYGYEIILELNNNGASVLGYAKEGTVYPILYRLQQAELIKCRIAPSTANGGSKKYYSLTGKGRETLEELLKFWELYSYYQFYLDNFNTSILNFAKNSKARSAIFCFFNFLSRMRSSKGGIKPKLAFIG